MIQSSSGDHRASVIESWIGGQSRALPASEVVDPDVAPPRQRPATSRDGDTATVVREFRRMNSP